VPLCLSPTGSWSYVCTSECGGTNRITEAK
jgi:hypothetical protein